MRPVIVAIAGSVDDGKSTLLGRLLNDTERVYADEVEAVRRASEGGVANLAFFTDGLITERARGITMDVAWRHYESSGKRFLLADVPGHAELVRNMATGASVADAAVLLVDAVRGVQSQTRRHLVMLSGLGVRRVLVCLNKMDGVGFSAEVAAKLSESLSSLGGALGLGLEFIPVAALDGDNVVHRSTRMGWYAGPTLAARLLELELVARHEHLAWVQLGTDASGWTSMHGAVRVGGEYVVTPDGGTVRVLEESPLGAGRVRLSRSLPRGVLLSAMAVPAGTAANASVTWIGADELSGDAKLTLLQPTRNTPCEVSVQQKRSLESGLLERAASLRSGDVGVVTLKLDTLSWLVGPAVLIDSLGQTVAAVSLK
ncbi:MAG: 50S ribosome-binding GTPase [Archangium sp.]|nr:50S ribosome-binding GTPase [Archangium sp.]